MHSAVPTSSIHGEGKCPKQSESFFVEVFSTCHRSHDDGKRLELLSFGTQKGLCLEEGDDLRQQIIPFADHVHQRGVRGSAVVLTYPSAVEAFEHQVEDLTTLGVLTAAKLGDQLPSDSGTRIPIDGDVERTFSVDIAGYVGVKPFLLIDRT
jgi:hypothetical protein